MGFDGMASQMIIFIAVVGASVLLVSSFSSQLSLTSDAINSQQDSLNLQLQTDITIESVVYESDTTDQIIFYVKNSGQTELRPERLSVYLDGDWIGNTSNRSIELVSDTNTVNPTVWDPKEVIKGVINQTLSSAYTHSLRLVTEHDTTEVYQFST